MGATPWRFESSHPHLQYQGVQLTPDDLDVVRVGSGPPVLLVHGSVVDARRTWRKQIEGLAGEWSLCLPNRPGFAGSPPIPRGDFDIEAPLFTPFLGEGAHLVGHSYGHDPEHGSSRYNELQLVPIGPRAGLIRSRSGAAASACRTRGPRRWR